MRFLLKPPSSRLRCRRSAGAPLIPATRLEPLLRAERELPVKLLAGVLAMDEVAEAAADAALARVEAAAGLAEVCDGAELAVYGARGVPAVVERVGGDLGAVFVFESGVDVADEVCGVC